MLPLNILLKEHNCRLSAEDAAMFVVFVVFFLLFFFFFCFFFPLSFSSSSSSSSFILFFFVDFLGKQRNSALSPPTVACGSWYLLNPDEKKTCLYPPTSPLSSVRQYPPRFTEINYQININILCCHLIEHPFREEGFLVLPPSESVVNTVLSWPVLDVLDLFYSLVRWYFLSASFYFLPLR